MDLESGDAQAGHELGAAHAENISEHVQSGGGSGFDEAAPVGVRHLEALEGLEHRMVSDQELGGGEALELDGGGAGGGGGGGDGQGSVQRAIVGVRHLRDDV